LGIAGRPHESVITIRRIRYLSATLHIGVDLRRLQGASRQYRSYLSSAYSTDDQTAGRLELDLFDLCKGSPQRL